MIFRRNVNDFPKITPAEHIALLSVVMLGGGLREKKRSRGAAPLVDEIELYVAHFKQCAFGAVIDFGNRDDDLSK